jgi:subtilase family serine protease
MRIVVSTFNFPQYSSQSHNTKCNQSGSPLKSPMALSSRIIKS